MPWYHSLRAGLFPAAERSTMNNTTDTAGNGTATRLVASARETAGDAWYKLVDVVSGWESVQGIGPEAQTLIVVGGTAFGLYMLYCIWHWGKMDEL